jgi:hypothetical protein
MPDARWNDPRDYDDVDLDYQRLQQLFFPEGIAYDGNRFNRTAATAPLFNYLAPSESADEKMVSLIGIEPFGNVAPVIAKDRERAGRVKGATRLHAERRAQASAPLTRPECSRKIGHRSDAGRAELGCARVVEQRAV